VAADGHAEVERVRLRPLAATAPSGEVDLAADTLVVAIGRQPAVELAALFGCALGFDPAAGGWMVRHDAAQRTTVPRVLVAGDICGIADADFATPTRAQATARQAAATARAALRPTPPTVPHPAPPNPLSTMVAQSAAFLTPWHELAESTAGPALIVCRCEEVTRADVLAAIDLVGADPDDVKRLSRAGMGLCQGRGCRPIVASLLAAHSGIPLASLPPTAYRPPIRPVPLAALATEPAETREPPAFVTRRISS
jgi:NAD(P)H-nitrite reductase large subunit